MRLRRYAVIIISILAGCGVPAPRTPRARAPIPSAAERVEEAVPLGRLPSDVRPERYSLALEIDPDQRGFQGEVSIHVRLAQSRKIVWLHGQGLSVEQAQVISAPFGRIQGRWQTVGGHGISKIELPRTIGPGLVELRIRYRAPFDTQLAGLYRVTHRNRGYAFTQFEPTYARKAFPCFDEPAFKTPFDVSLTIKRGHRAVTNSPELHRRELSNGLVRIRYATTAKLPTYLVAWAVGPLELVEAAPLPRTQVRKRKVPFRGVAVAGKGAQLAFALKHTGALIEALERYVGIPYPYKKLDVIAVPDFAAGAMENAGAITFREQYLLIDPKHASRDQLLKFYVIMAHELAHQWFGNLVTMYWWHDTWLNEAFATWLAARIVDEVRPELGAGLDQMLAGHYAMQRDSLLSARRIRQPILSDHDIHSAFDPITYNKGAQVIAMFEKWLGDVNFQRGLNTYLNKHKNGNARAEDLLLALSESAGKDVATPFRTFLHQSGIPMLSAGLVCKGRQASIRVTQSRYLPAGAHTKESSKWQIPLCVRYGSAQGVNQECFLMKDRSMEEPLSNEGCPDWMMPNAAGAGYYRWQLQEPDFRRLTQRGWRHLTSAERASYGESVRAAFFSGGLSASTVFEALQPLARDEEHAVAYQPMPILEFTREYLLDKDTIMAFSAYASALYRSSYRRLGWRSDRKALHDNPLLRSYVVRFMALVARDPKVRQEAAARAHAYIGFGGDGGLHPESMEPELRLIALAVATEEGDKAWFNALRKVLAKSEDAAVRQDVISALGFAQDPELAQYARSLTLDTGLRSNEAMLPLVYQMDSPEQRDATWRWIQEHFEELTQRLPERALGTLPWLTRKFCNADRAQKVRQFFEPRIDTLIGGPRHLVAALESINLCVEVVKLQEDKARNYFSRVRM
ncbi:MAG: M1 family metallopeptidase [Myxococcales bacterium]|nr:M1 family metallopeptidase [Myxococcales bacterium]